MIIHDAKIKKKKKSVTSKKQKSKDIHKKNIKRHSQNGCKIFKLPAQSITVNVIASNKTFHINEIQSV